MKRWPITILLLCFVHYLAAQEKNYADTLRSFREKYIREHEVVNDSDRASLQFYPIDKEYAVLARLEKIDDAPWFPVPTSGTKKKIYRVYGILHFTLKGRQLKLQVLQSQDLLTHTEYANYLLIAFTDKTSGGETYANGRYIDATTVEMDHGNYLLDFNKSYNPYCAYITNKYNCPIPPKDNDLPLFIEAGEMKFGRKN